MATKKKILLHPADPETGEPVLDVELYPKTLETAIVDINGNVIVFQKKLPNATTAGKVLTSTDNHGGVAWLSPGGGGNGDVTGPNSSTNNALAIFDGTSGKVIKNSNLTLSNVGIMSGGALDINSPSTSVTSHNVKYVFEEKEEGVTEQTVAVKEEFGGSKDTNGNWTSITINGVNGSIPTGGGGGEGGSNQKLKVQNGTSFGNNVEISLVASGDITLAGNTTNNTITIGTNINMTDAELEDNN